MKSQKRRVTIDESLDSTPAKVPRYPSVSKLQNERRESNKKSGLVRTGTIANIKQYKYVPETLEPIFRNTNQVIHDLFNMTNADLSPIKVAKFNELRNEELTTILEQIVNDSILAVQESKGKLIKFSKIESKGYHCLDSPSNIKNRIGFDTDITPQELSSDSEEGSMFGRSNSPERGESAQMEHIDEHPTLEENFKNSDKYQEMNEQIHTLKTEVKKMAAKFQQKTDIVNKLRYDFLTELQVLRQQVLSKKEKPDENFQPVDVYFFSPTEELDEKTCYILNAKMNEVRDNFNHRLQMLYAQNKQLLKDIDNFEHINQDCEGGEGIFVGFREMNADAIVKKMAILELSAEKIWIAVEKNYGHGFFEEIIEQEYNIDPNVNMEIQRQFNEKLTEYQRLAMDQLRKFTEKSRNEIEYLKNNLKQKGEEIHEIKRFHGDEMTKTKKELTEVLTFKFEEKEAVLYTKFDDIKTELHRKINRLERGPMIVDHSLLYARLKIKLMIQKWSFLTKLHKIRDSGTQFNERALRDAEYYIANKQKLAIADATVDLSSRITDLMDDKYKIMCDNAEFKFENYTIKRLLEALQMEMKATDYQFEDLNEQLDRTKQDLRLLEHEHDHMRSSLQSAHDYIKMLETTIFDLEQQIKRSSKKEAIKTKSQTLFDAEELRKKALNTLHTEGINKVTELLKAPKEDRGSLTVLFGINKQIRFEEEACPTVERGVWACIDQEDQGTQMEYEEGMGDEYPEMPQGLIQVDQTSQSPIRSPVHSPARQPSPGHRSPAHNRAKLPDFSQGIQERPGTNQSHTRTNRETTTLSESGEEIEGALSRPKTRESRYSRKHTPIESIRASRHTLEDPLEEGRELSDADGDEFSRFGDDLGADEGEAIRPVTGQSSRTKTTIKQVVSGYLEPGISESELRQPNQKSMAELSLSHGQYPSIQASQHSLSPINKIRDNISNSNFHKNSVFDLEAREALQNPENSNLNQSLGSLMNRSLEHAADIYERRIHSPEGTLFGGILPLTNQQKVLIQAGVLSPNGQLSREFKESLKKNKKKLKRPVFKVIPFNIKCLENIMHKAIKGRGAGTKDAYIQTDEDGVQMSKIANISQNAFETSFRPNTSQVIYSNNTDQKYINKSYTPQIAETFKQPRLSYPQQFNRGRTALGIRSSERDFQIEEEIVPLYLPSNPKLLKGMGDREKGVFSNVILGDHLGPPPVPPTWKLNDEGDISNIIMDMKKINPKSMSSYQEYVKMRHKMKHLNLHAHTTTGSRKQSPENTVAAAQGTSTKGEQLIYSMDPTAKVPHHNHHRHKTSSHYWKHQIKKQNTHIHSIYHQHNKSIGGGVPGAKKHKRAQYINGGNTYGTLSRGGYLGGHSLNAGLGFGGGNTGIQSPEPNTNTNNNSDTNTNTNTSTRVNIMQTGEATRKSHIILLDKLNRGGKLQIKKNIIVDIPNSGDNTQCVSGRFGAGGQANSGLSLSNRPRVVLNNVLLKENPVLQVDPQGGIQGVQNSSPIAHEFVNQEPPMPPLLSGNE